MENSCKRSHLDNILDSIMKFLQYDVRLLFGSAANKICNMNFSKSSVGSELDFIEHSYACRPKILNGDEEEEEEPEQEQEEITELEWCLPIVEPENECCSKKQKQIANCSKQMDDDICLADFENEVEEELSCSSEEEDEEDLDDCTNECKPKTTTNNSCKKECGAKNICKEIYQKIQQKCSTASVNQLTDIEMKAMKLWNCMNKNVSSCTTNTGSTWCQLKAGQKLPFYWAALSDDAVVTEDPYENFKRFYLANIPKDKRCSKKTNEKLLIVWHTLATEQKLPFIMEAFIGKIGGGKVNICDEHEIQRIMKRLQRNCT